MARATIRMMIFITYTNQ